MDAHHIDDVDMHEVEGQLPHQDEQQHQAGENYNLDEQNGGDDEEGDEEGDGEVEEEEEDDEAEQDEDSDDDDDYEATRLLSFERSCDRIEQNDPNLAEYSCAGLNDNRAVQLGRALLGNTELTKLTVSFRGRPELTSRGVKAFFGGVVGSQIKSLTLCGSEEPPLEMSQLCVPSIEKLVLSFPIGDEFAIQLSESLTASKLLRYFSIQVSQMTPPGAQALSNFLCNSPIVHLDFWNFPSEMTVLAETMKILYLEGVQNCQNIQDLYLDTVGDMRALVTTLPKLCNLTIDSVHLSLAEVELLTHGLSHAIQLDALSLKGCGLKDEHVRVLLSAFDTRNHTGNSGVTLFADNQRLELRRQQLTLSVNAIGSKGAELLIKAFSNNFIFGSLDLSSNISIGFDGLELIGKALPGAKILILDLREVVNWIEYEDVACDAAVIQEVKRTAANKALLEGVRANVYLMKLKLDDNVPTHVMEEISLYMQANLLGRCAVLGQSHALPSGVWSYFFAKEGMTSSLLFLFLRELPGILVGGSRNNTIGRKRRRL